MSNNREQATAHVMVTGKTGSGKTLLSARITHLFLAHSDVSQLKAQYAGEDLERMAEAIRKNCSMWYSLKSGDERHDK